MTAPDTTTSTIDAELSAIAAVADALEPLDQPARRRVLLWLAAFHGMVQPVAGAPLDEDALVRAAAGWACDVMDMVDVESVKQQALDGLGMGDDPDITGSVVELIKRAWRLASGTSEARELWPST